MKRWALFTISITLISTLAVAQAVVTPSGQATQQGAAVPMAPISPPQVTTPIIHLGTAPMTTGISNGPGMTGSAVEAPQPPSAVPIRPEINLGPANVYVGGTAVVPSIAEAANNESTQVSEQHRVVNVGVSSGAVVSADDGTSGRPLGDIARENRQKMQSVNARTFTNADVQRAAGTGGVSGIAANAGNSTYPADNGVINSNGIAAPATNVPPTTEQQNVRQQTPVTTEQPGQKPSAATPPPQEMSQAQTPANPADQNAANATNQGEQRTLPQSASPLPLIAFVGFSAIAAGWFVRRTRA